MSIILVLLYIAVGMALSETYAYIRRRAEERAYNWGYNQATREKELWEAGINQYGITIPRTMDGYTEGQRPLGVPASAPVADEHFMQHLAQNGRATVQYHRGACKNDH